jgi:hypothetical protein
LTAYALQQVGGGIEVSKFEECRGMCQRNGNARLLRQIYCMGARIDLAALGSTNSLLVLSPCGERERGLLERDRYLGS